MGEISAVSTDFYRDFLLSSRNIPGNKKNRPLKLLIPSNIVFAHFKMAGQDLAALCFKYQQGIFPFIGCRE